MATIVLSALAISGTAQAHGGSHVEYVVPDQDGISVVQKGNSGIVNVTVTHCLKAGEEFAFTMLISSDREGSSTLSVRKNGNVDISDWFSLSQKTVDLPSDGTEVTVKVKPPVDVEVEKMIVTRIQEIGDGPRPGGHHGVKVFIDCVEAPTPPEPTPEPTPGPTPPPGVTPEPTPGPTPIPTATSTVQPPSPTPEPQMPTALPDSGGEPLQKETDSPWRYVVIGVAVLAVSGGLLSLSGRSWFS